jgi:hypothetical protein
VDIQLHSFLTSVLDEVSGQLYALAVLRQGKRPWYTLKRRLRGLQSWSGHFAVEKSPLLLCRIEQLKYGMNIIALIMV